MSICSFCGNTVEKGTGVMYVEKDGKIFHFCSSKCEKNQLQLHRNPRVLKWTKSFMKKGVKHD